MAPGSVAADWERLKPKILRLLEAGKKRREVVKEISKDGSSISSVSYPSSFEPLSTNNQGRLAQLDYQLKGWGKRMKLTADAWKHISYKVEKRTRSKKSSVVFFNGVRIPPAKVDKETRRYDRPTLLPAPGGKFDTQNFIEDVTRRTAC